MIFHVCSNSTTLLTVALNIWMITWDLIQVFLHTSKRACNTTELFWMVLSLVMSFYTVESLVIEDRKYLEAVISVLWKYITRESLWAVLWIYIPTLWNYSLLLLFFFFCVCSFSTSRFFFYLFNILVSSIFAPFSYVAALLFLSYPTRNRQANKIKLADSGA